VKSVSFGVAIFVASGAIGLLHSVEAKADFSSFLRSKKRDWHYKSLPQHSVSHDSITSSSCLTDQLVDIPRDWQGILDHIKEKFNVVVYDERKYLTTNTLRWTSSDLGILLHTLNNLPEHFFPLKNQIKIMKTGREGGYAKNAVARYVDRRIEIYDDLYQHFRSDYERIGAFTHEFGHVLAGELGLTSGKNGFSSLNSWESEGALNYEEFVSTYATTENGEDFAESFTAYRYNPLALKKVAPKKYEYLKVNLFQGIEYLSEKTCESSNFYFQKESKTVPTLITSSIESCELMASRVYFNYAKKEDLVACLNEKLKYKEVDLDLTKIPNIYRSRVKEMYEQDDFPRLKSTGLPDSDISRLADEMSNLGLLLKPSSSPRPPSTRVEISRDEIERDEIEIDL
jgi:hypothetical protein